MCTEAPGPMSLLPIPCPWSLRLQISRPSLITVITVAGGTVSVAGSKGASVYIRIVAVAGVGANPLPSGIGFTDGIPPIVGVAATTGNGEGAGGWAAVTVAPHPARPAISATPNAVLRMGPGRRATIMEAIVHAQGCEKWVFATPLRRPLLSLDRC